MPRNVRNFWLDGDIDGRKSGISGGPQAKDGGFSLTIKQRDNGQVTTGLRIDGYAFLDGTLQLRIRDGSGKVIHEHETRR